MPVYMDRHYIEGATRHAVADAHQKDLALQDRYHVKFLTYWFDETRSTAFCLIEAPNRETIERAHNEAHGSVPNEVIEVDPAVVDAFLGRIKDPPPRSQGKSREIPIDSGFRAIMFTDLKDSTRMTTLYGDAKALHMLHVHNALTRNSLNAHRGREIKHTGDGIMASFASVPDAVACAIAMLQALEEFNRTRASENQAPIRIGIGINTGNVITGSIGSTRALQYTAIGDAMNVASRLVNVAGSGEIIISEHTYRHVAGRVEATQLPPVKVKGKAEELKVYRVTGLRNLQTPVPGDWAGPTNA